MKAQVGMPAGVPRSPRAHRSTAAAAGFPVPEASTREPLLPPVLLRLRAPVEDVAQAFLPVRVRFKLRRSHRHECLCH